MEIYSFTVRGIQIDMTFKKGFVAYTFEKDGKSFPTIELRPDNQKPRKDGSMPFGFSFGLGKARLILAHLEDIKGFVAQY